MCEGANQQFTGVLIKKQGMYAEGDLIKLVAVLIKA